MSRRSARNAGAASESLAMQSAQTHLMPSVPASQTVSSNLYLQNYYGHPSNTRLLIGNMSQTGGKRHRGRSSTLKPPKPPEKPAIPYMRYSRKVWDDVKVGSPELKLWEIGKIVGQMWRELPATDKQQFTEEYEVAKMEHAELLKAYYTSPAYQAYLHAKSRDDAIEAAAEGLGGDKDDAYMSIEPIDEAADDSDMSFSVKHVAAARFQRNHRLINDILGEAIHVPSTRAVVTTQRLIVLKNQVHSLELHQKKLENELVHLEELHVVKKRKWVDQARDFGKEMKRLRSITPQEYYKEYKLKQQQAAAQQKQIEEARKEKLAKEKADELKEKPEEKKAEKPDEKEEDTEGKEEAESSAATPIKEPDTDSKEEKMETEESNLSADNSEQTPEVPPVSEEVDPEEEDAPDDDSDNKGAEKQSEETAITEKSEDP